MDENTENNKPEEETNDSAAAPEGDTNSSDTSPAPEEDVNPSEIKPEPEETAAPVDVTSEPETHEEKPKIEPVMVPLWSWRTALIVGIGLIVGIIAAFGFWLVSPSVGSGSGGESEGFSNSILKAIGSTPESPWKSKVRIEIVNPGTAVKDVRQMQSMGQYLTSKANSFPFLQYVYQELSKELPGNHYTIDDLNNMIDITFDSTSETPTMVISVTATTMDETSFLISEIPNLFQSYLITEESKKQMEEYEGTLQQIDEVKKALLVAQKDVANLKEQADGVNGNDSRSLALNAQIEALQNILDQQAQMLSSEIASGNITEMNDIETEYQNTLAKTQSVSNDLSQAKKDLQNIEIQRANNSLVYNKDYIILDAKARALELELNKLMTGDALNPGLAGLIAVGADQSAVNSTMLSVQAVGDELAKAKRELDTMKNNADYSNLDNNLDYQLAQDKVTTLENSLASLRNKLSVLNSQRTSGQQQSETKAAFDRTSIALAQAKQELADVSGTSSEDYLKNSLEYQVAQSKVDTLNDQLSTLNDKLSSTLVASIETSNTVDYLAVGNPSIPSLVFPSRMRIRNALLVGAILGALIAWIILNFRWLRKTLFTSKGEETE
jgi:hypothetical protein